MKSFKKGTANILHWFKQLTVLPALPIPAFFTAFVFISVFISNTALADSRFSFNNNNRNFTSNNSNHNGRNTGFQNHNTRFGSYNSSRNNSFWNSQIYNNSRFNNNFNRSRFNTYNTYSPYRNQYRNDNWSISLNLGNSRNSFSNSYAPLNTRATQTRIIYNQPNVVVVTDGSRSTGSVYQTTAKTYEYSLLRDIHGNCFERSYDNQGRENRVQLPDAACNF
ncbi:MAG: hypothetical protein P8M72_03485 [Gammaproteobacteria bacterium]|nr:hypothetical protein [Gammaproteobacteria bacterium]